MATQIKEKLTSMNELDRFCNEYGLYMELEKPFPNMDELILSVTFEDGTVVEKITVNEILEIEKDAATILNSISKDF